MSYAGRPFARSKRAPGAIVAAAAVLAGLGAAFAAPAAGVPARAQAPAECSLTVDKTALPTTIWLGETVTVTLSIGGTCPAKEVKADVLAIDRSSSMERYNKLTSARAAAKSFIDTINPSLVHVGIVAFDDVAESIAYLTGDQAALRRPWTASAPTPARTSSTAWTRRARCWPAPGRGRTRGR
ncbi:MAG: vWA domain-containing protein [Anaerolineae bacterium]